MCIFKEQMANQPEYFRFLILNIVTYCFSRSSDKISLRKTIHMHQFTIWIDHSCSSMSNHKHSKSIFFSSLKHKIPGSTPQLHCDAMFNYIERKKTHSLCIHYFAVNSSKFHKYFSGKQQQRISRSNI